MGIFSGSGVGKSVLLGMMARYTAADVNVIGLIGERGREVNEFLQRDLGPEGLARSVVVVAPSDQTALVRDRGVLSRPGQGRAADDGFRHAICRGATRNWPGRRRAPDNARLSTVGVCHAAETAGTSRPQPARKYHRILLRTGRG